MRFTRAGEARLRKWMAQHARVCWVEHPEPWKMEEVLLEELFLPLNLAGNSDHPFHHKLSEIRRHSRVQAKRLPPIRGARDY